MFYSRRSCRYLVGPAASRPRLCCGRVICSSSLFLRLPPKFQGKPEGRRHFIDSKLFPNSASVGVFMASLFLIQDDGEVQQYTVLSEMWCLGNGRCITPKYSLRAKKKKNFPSVQQRIRKILIKRPNLFLCLSYVFHSAGILPEPSFQGRVDYLGRPGTKNCSLRISDLRESDSGTYVFYLITDHPTEKMPDQSGIQLLVAGRGFYFIFF